MPRIPVKKSKKVVVDEEIKDAASEGLAVPEAPALSGSAWAGEGNPVDDQTVTLGSSVYRFKKVMEKAYDVQIGATKEESFENLKKAVNQAGQSGVNYFEGTRGESLVPLEITL